MLNSTSMATSTDYDRCNIKNSQAITSQFEKGEKILLSTLLIKVNQVNKKQTRILLITNKSIYNIIPEGDNVIFRIIGKLIQVQKIKRKINLTYLYGVTVSNIGSEFVLHVPTEYDYRFQSSDFRKQILETLIFAYTQANQKSMPFFEKDGEFSLHLWTTTENDAKNKISKMPKEAPLLFSVEEFKQWSNQKNKSELVKVGKGMKASNGLTIEDFELIKVLGRGAFGKVMMCEKKDTKELYAIKSLRKDNIVDKNQVEHTRTERKLLEQIDSPFLVSLEYAFQTKDKLFFVMKFMRGGELFKHLREKRRFPEPTAKFYAGSIILALEYLHKLGVVYRDLKPENILMSEDGYVKLTDFGLAKFLQPNALTYSFVGTPEYLAPEIIRQQGHYLEVDWWSLGILIYEMVVGRPPFYSQNQNQLFRAIIDQELAFPSQVQISNDLKDLIKQLLQKNPSVRLGHKDDAVAIKSHPWFKDLNFNDLEEKKIGAPIVPKLFDVKDVQNFDKEFTDEAAVNSVVNMDPKIIEQFRQEFGAVTYIPNGLG